MKKGKRIMIITACAFLLLGLFGCKPEEEEEIIDGGTTDRTDKDAPKEILSKEIRSFSVNLYLDNRWNSREDHFFNFSVEPDENGTLTAAERNTEIRLEADQELLDSLQAIIDRYELVKANGIYRVTAGLPPEYQERSLAVEYVSGEQLYFTENNDPAERWAEEIYDVFASWFEKRGIQDLYPEKETSPLTRIDCLHTEDGILREEETVLKDGETMWRRYVYDLEKEEEVTKEIIALPDGFLENVAAILSRHEVVRKYEFSRYDYEECNYGNHDRGYYGFGAQPQDEEDDENRYVELYFEYESGSHYDIETRKPSEIEGMRDLLKDLEECFASLSEK